MLNTSLLSSVAKQLSSADEIEIEGRRLPVRRTSKQGLRTVNFTMGDREYSAIEQNCRQAEPLGSDCPERASGCAVQGCADQPVRGGRSGR